MRGALSLLALTIVVSGCATTNPHAELEDTETIPSYQTFRYEHTALTGMDFRPVDERLLKEVTESTVIASLVDRGFQEVDENYDFYAVVTWEKAVSSYPRLFDSVDGPADSLDRRRDPSYRFAPRLHLMVEFYDSTTRHLFWRKSLPNIFDAVQLKEARVVDSIHRALENYPLRVE